LSKKEECIHVRVCGSSWGIGAYDTGDAEFGVIYGFPPTSMNPHKFWPDRECCSEKEIEAHRAACAEWDKNHPTPPSSQAGGK